MFDLIEIELKRIRRMAHEAEDSFLDYLIDLAIIQANKRARDADIETRVAESTHSPQHDIQVRT